MERGLEHDTEVLIRQVDGHLATLRTARGRHDLALAERLAASLRHLLRATTDACAADRARVRAAVHYFVLRRDARYDRLPVRSLAADQRVINETAQHLGRADLIVTADVPTQHSGPVQSARSVF